jgi:sugar lactone lactonase YvrE
VVALLAGSAPAQAQPARTIEGLAFPESTVVGPDNRLYVSEIGEFGKDGDGKVTVVDPSGKLQPFAQGLDDPKGLASANGVLYAADKTRIWKIDAQGKAAVFVPSSAFPQPPLFLNDLVADPSGNLYVSDSGDSTNGGKGAIYTITPAGKVSTLISEAQDRRFKSPNGLLFDGEGRLLVTDFATGELLRIDLRKGMAVEKLADGFGAGDGLARDASGTIYVSDWKNGKVWKVDGSRPGAKPQQYAQTFKAAADIALSSDGKFLLVPDMKAGTLTWLPK